MKIILNNETIGGEKLTTPSLDSDDLSWIITRYNKE